MSILRVLRKPLITEKGALNGAMNNGVVFEVDKKATKIDIRRAVESAFDVKVKAVRTMNYMGKKKRVKGRVGQQSDWKKAYVSLAEGSSIDMIEGL